MKRRMIVSMPRTARPQQPYDHRVRDLVHRNRNGDVTVATRLGVPRSTARGWLGEVPRHRGRRHVRSERTRGRSAQARVEANRSASCAACPSVEAAA